MFSLFTVFLAICIYIALLFAVANTAERKQALLKRHYVWIYALSLGVYQTAWGFYGNVGYASSHGFMFFLYDIGAFACIAFWWLILRRMVIIKEALHITSLADMISARYNRSTLVALVVTLIAVLGSVPYIGLQIKAVVESVSVLTSVPVENEDITLTGLGCSVILLLFTIFYGIRKLDPTAHHYGMLVIIACECLIKLAALFLVGIFVTFGLYQGFGDIFSQLQQQELSHITGLGPEYQRSSTAIGIFIIGFFSILMLPRQFHIAVVENASQNHIRPAALILIGYLLLFSLFTVPIAGAGILQGIPGEQADMMLLLISMQNGQEEIALITFIGGFAAASGMVIVTTTTISTMVANHLLLPLAERWHQLNWIRSYLLQVRWAVAFAVILSGYIFVTALTASYLLPAIGTLAMTALLQLVPALFGGLFWHRANSRGALWGMLLGMLVWFYTLLLPVLIRQFSMEAALLESGPFEISWLRPGGLLGFNNYDNTFHGLMFSLGLNSILFILISLLSSPNKEERNLTEEFMALFSRTRERQIRPTGLDDYILMEDKRAEAIQLLVHYLRHDKAEALLEQIENDLHIDNKKTINIIELVEYHRMIEHELAGSIGAASSHSAIKSQLCYSNREANELQAIYHHISRELSTPAPARRSDRRKADSAMQVQVRELANTVASQQQEIEALLDRLDQRYEEIHKYRMQAQQYRDSLEQLKARQSGRDTTELEQENKRLKMLYAEQSLQLDRLRKEQD